MSTIAAKKICNNILDAIGDTPMVRINRITQGVVTVSYTHLTLPTIYSV